MPPKSPHFSLNLCDLARMGLFAELSHTMASGNSLILSYNWIPNTHPSKSQSPLQFCTTSCNHPHMWYWHLVFSTMAHIIRPSFKQACLAPGQRGNFLYVGGGYTGWLEVGVNEPLTESYHLERFWHAEVAAAYTLASSRSWPALKLISRDECL